jgi:hypothetical protein
VWAEVNFDPKRGSIAQSVEVLQNRQLRVTDPGERTCWWLVGHPCDRARKSTGGDTSFRYQGSPKPREDSYSASSCRLENDVVLAAAFAGQQRQALAKAVAWAHECRLSEIGKDGIRTRDPGSPCHIVESTAIVVAFSPPGYADGHQLMRLIMPHRKPGGVHIIMVKALSRLLIHRLAVEVTWKRSSRKRCARSSGKTCSEVVSMSSSDHHRVAMIPS